MKKITSPETIEFMISGIKGTPTENTVVIDEKGVIVSDEDAVLVAARFGGLVNITNADAKAVKEAAQQALVEEEIEDEETEETEEAPQAPKATTRKKSA
jgi:hypothetical protein